MSPTRFLCATQLDSIDVGLFFHPSWERQSSGTHHRTGLEPVSLNIKFKLTMELLYIDLYVLRAGLEPATFSV